MSGCERASASTALLGIMPEKPQVPGDQSFGELVANMQIAFRENNELSRERQEVVGSGALPEKQQLKSDADKADVCDQVKEADVRKTCKDDGLSRDDKAQDEEIVVLSPVCDVELKPSDEACDIKFKPSDEANAQLSQGDEQPVITAEQQVALLPSVPENSGDRVSDKTPVDDEIPVSDEKADEEKKEPVSCDVATVVVGFVFPSVPSVSEQPKNSEKLANVEAAVVQELGRDTSQNAELTEVVLLDQQTELKDFGLPELGKFVEFMKESDLKIELKPPTPKRNDELVSDVERLSHNVVDFVSGEAGLEQQDTSPELNLTQDESQASEADVQHDASKPDSTNTIGPGQVDFGPMEATPEPIEPEVITRQIVDKVEEVASTIQTGSREFVMSLEPKELGKLAIEISVENGKVTMLKIQAENNQTRMLLERQIPELEQKFEGCVVKVETASANSFESSHSEDAAGSGLKENLDRQKNEQEKKQSEILFERRTAKFAVSP
ncbi:hypothetical protein FACS1894198_2010 [Clostridia bacterium]|nr:hypothetical protein FACS1894198_2010 [Clostridia bacterium]